MKVTARAIAKLTNEKWEALEEYQYTEGKITTEDEEIEVAEIKIKCKKQFNHQIGIDNS